MRPARAGVGGDDVLCVEDLHIDTARSAHCDAVGRLPESRIRTVGEEVAAGEECRIGIRHGHKIGVRPYRLFLQARDCQRELLDPARTARGKETNQPGSQLWQVALSDGVPGGRAFRSGAAVGAATSSKETSGDSSITSNPLAAMSMTARSV